MSDTVIANGSDLEFMSSAETRDCSPEPNDPIPDPELPQVAGWSAFLRTGDAKTPEFPTLEATLRNFFPLKVGSGGLYLDLVEYEVELPRISPTEARAVGGTFAASISCKVRLRSTAPSPSTPALQDSERNSTIVLALPAITESATFVIRGQEMVLVTERRLAPGAVIAVNDRDTTRLRSLPDDNVDEREPVGGFATIVSDSNRQLRLRYTPDALVEVDLGNGQWLPSTILFRALGAESERDLLHLFCVERLINNKSGKASGAVSIDEKEVIAREVSLPSEDDDNSVALHRACEILTRGEVAELVTIGAQCSVYRWREHFLLNDPTTGIPSEPQPHRRLASDVVGPLTGDILAAAGQPADAATTGRLRTGGVTSIELEGESSAELIEPLLRTWRCDGVRSRREALRLAAATLDLEWYEESSMRQTIDTILSPPHFSLTGEGRGRFERLVGRSESGMLGVGREDLAAMVARLMEICHERVSPPDSAHLENFSFACTPQALNEGLAQSFRILNQILWSETRRIGREVSAKHWAQLCGRVLSKRLESWMEQRCARISSTERRRDDAMFRQVIDRDPVTLSDPRAAALFSESHPSWYGRLCMIDAENAVRRCCPHQLAKYVRIEPNGVAVAPYWLFAQGKRTGQIAWLSAPEEWEETVAAYQAEEELGGNPVGVRVACRRRGEGREEFIEAIRFMDIAIDHGLSITASRTPFLSHSSWFAIQRGCEASRNAVPLVRAEKPLVSASRCGASIRPEKSGFKDGDQPFGTHLRTAYLSWYGANFRDSVIVSRDVIEKGKLTSDERKRFSISLYPLLSGATFAPQLAAEARIAEKYHLDAGLDAAGIIRVGSQVKEARVLVSLLQPPESLMRSPQEQLLQAILAKTANWGKDVSVAAPPGLHGVVTDVWIEVSSPKQADTVRAIILRTVAAERVRIRAVVSARLQVIIGEKHEGRESRAQKAQTAHLSLEESQLKELALDDRDLAKLRAINPRANGALTNLWNAQKQLQEYCDVTERYWSTPSHILVRDRVQSPCIQMRLHDTRPLRIGDIIRTRHGGGGIVAGIQPPEDMPVLPDGTPVELILNPLSLLGESRFGELLEATAALAAEHARCRLIAPLFTRGGPEQVRLILRCALVCHIARSNRSECAEALDQVLGPEAISRNLIDRKIYSFRQVEDCADKNGAARTLAEVHRCLDEMSPRYAKSGALDPIVSNGEQGQSIEERIDAILGYNGVEPDCRYWLRDGLTGMQFAQPTTFGLTYVYRLSSEPLCARSTDAYALVSQQPLPHDTLKGGQRLDSGAILALAAYGSAHSLREFSTIKSDDISGRAEAVHSIYSGGDILPPIMAVSVHSMFLELCASGISVKLGKRNTDSEGEH